MEVGTAQSAFAHPAALPFEHSLSKIDKIVCNPLSGGKPCAQVLGPRKPDLGRPACMHPEKSGV